MALWYFLHKTFANTIGYLLPAYWTWKTVRSETEDEEKLRKLLMFWTVFGLFSFVEFYLDLLIAWVPLYLEAKALFIVWLGYGGGGERLYEGVLHQYLLAHEDRIDAAIEDAKGNVRERVNVYGRRMIEFTREKAGLAMVALTSTLLSGQLQLTGAPGQQQQQPVMRSHARVMELDDDNDGAMADQQRALTPRRRGSARNAPRRAPQQQQGRWPATRRRPSASRRASAPDPDPDFFGDDGDDPDANYWEQPTQQQDGAVYGDGDGDEVYQEDDEEWVAGPDGEGLAPPTTPAEREAQRKGWFGTLGNVAQSLYDRFSPPNGASNANANATDGVDPIPYDDDGADAEVFDPDLFPASAPAPSQAQQQQQPRVPGGYGRPLPDPPGPPQAARTGVVHPDAAAVHQPVVRPIRGTRNPVLGPGGKPGMNLGPARRANTAVNAQLLRGGDGERPQQRRGSAAQIRRPSASAVPARVRASVRPRGQTQPPRRAPEGTQDEAGQPPATWPPADADADVDGAVGVGGDIHPHVTERTGSRLLSRRLQKKSGK